MEDSSLLEENKILYSSENVSSIAQLQNRKKSISLNGFITTLACWTEFQDSVNSNTDRAFHGGAILFFYHSQICHQTEAGSKIRMFPVIFKVVPLKITYGCLRRGRLLLIWGCLLRF